ncbi:MAG: F0F1 ATP synthase subunit B' [Oscillatoriales cyanobacterium RM2_1_1]|nr:F0F1 ATP synthase subunit B' [Oscillatoriales cyanobacterium SM2_3_0]NJO45120.1 F0F1 ATP synthase subunit B' [Oscillatoriales cyanobacterium RM2_1_1]
MMHWTILLAVEETAKEGGLFDLDATLPIVAIEFLILAFVLNTIFYKPLGRAIDERTDYVRNNKLQAQERLAKAEKLAQEYEQKLASSRKQSQSVIQTAQEDARKIAAEKIAEAQQEAQRQREQVAQEIAQERQQAMQSLEQQVEPLSRQILEKLLGSVLSG